MKIRRNALCTCGSGKKYKRCCQEKHASQDASWTKGTRLLVVIVSALLLSGFVMLLTQADTTSSSASIRPGQVWSPEHGHWHDVR